MPNAGCGAEFVPLCRQFRPAYNNYIYCVSAIVRIRPASQKQVPMVECGKYNANGIAGWSTVQTLEWENFESKSVCGWFWPVSMANQ